MIHELVGQVAEDCRGLIPIRGNIPVVAEEPPTRVDPENTELARVAPWKCGIFTGNTNKHPPDCVTRSPVIRAPLR